MKKIILLLLAFFPITASAQPVLDDAYYNNLRKACKNNSWFNAVDSCCESSVDTMESLKAIQHDPILTVECPEGYTKNMLKCESSYQWCEPMEKKAEPKEETK